MCKHATPSDDPRAGFTLIEALVALSLLLAFAAALGPLMFHSRNMIVHGDGQVKAELLLRSLLETPLDRINPELGAHEGRSGGMQWQLTVEPTASLELASEVHSETPKKDEHHWSLLHIKAHVAWGEQAVTGETLRLAETR